MLLIEPTIDDAIAEIDRELQVRARVYPQWVSRGKVTQEKADRCTADLKAARAFLFEYRKLKGA